MMQRNRGMRTLHEVVVFGNLLRCARALHFLQQCVEQMRCELVDVSLGEPRPVRQSLLAKLKLQGTAAYIS